jgi:hypothetical protein
VPGASPARSDAQLQWKTADLLEATIPISGRETVLNTVEVPGQQPVTLAPVCLPYSPEFAPEQPGRGGATLAELAAITGGKERIEIPQAWADLPSRRHYIETIPWLLVAAVVLFLIEILERRAGWVSRVLTRQKPAAEAEEAQPRRADAADRRVSVFAQVIVRRVNSAGEGADPKFCDIFEFTGGGADFGKAGGERFAFARIQP